MEEREPVFFMVYSSLLMTSYNRDYNIPKDTRRSPYTRELTPLEKELVKRVKVAKKARQEVIAKAQAREREAYNLKMQRLRQQAETSEDEAA
jgi:hypothetical protein